MKPWLISIPCWGPRAIGYLRSGPLQSLLFALGSDAENRARIVIHTNAASAFADLPVETRTIPDAEIGWEFGACHQEALDLAEPGQKVSLLCADIMVSRELFDACDRRLDGGYEMVACLGNRSQTPWHPGPLPHPPFAQVGMSGRELMEYSFTHLHPLCRQSVWGYGKTAWPSIIYFPLMDGVVAHAFHLHPIALRKVAGVGFNGPTIDNDLPMYFSEKKIHVEIEHEFAVAEFSPADRGANIISTRRFGVEDAKLFVSKRTNPRHRWFFDFRIPMVGECKDESELPIVREILEAYS